MALSDNVVRDKLEGPADAFPTDQLLAEYALRRKAIDDSTEKIYGDMLRNHLRLLFKMATELRARYREVNSDEFDADFIWASGELKAAQNACDGAARQHPVVV